MATNSIIIANLPDWSINTPSNTQNTKQNDKTETVPSTFIDSLRAVIEVHREIVHWVPVRSFRRIFCVFINSDDAEVVKCALNGCIFEGHRLDVYFGENTPLTIEKKHLEPPVLQKNWLISPPGSPQEGWVQIEEDPPNSMTLHEDIQTALDRLTQELGQTEDEDTHETNDPRGNVILDTTSLGGVQVIVHDWDSMASSDDEFGGKGIRATRTSAAVIGKTPRPSSDSE